MNYLGHLILAEDCHESRIGHYLGDFVKGAVSGIREKFPPKVADGIVSHRRTDGFTDAHPAVKSAVARCRPAAEKYAPIVVDLMFDHYLIKHWNQFIQTDFDDFVSTCYGSLESLVDNHLYPGDCRLFTRRLIDRDAFHVYASLDGVHQALCGIDRRAAHRSPLPCSLAHIKRCYSSLEQSFLKFMPDLLAL